MKRYLLALLSFVAVSEFAFADGEYNGYCPGGPLRSLINPCGFYVGLTGLYAVPSETGLGTFTDSWLYANPDGSTTALSKPHKPHYQTAGAIKLGYDIPNTANNLELEYTYLFNVKRSVFDTSDNPIGFGSVFFNVFIPIAPGDVLASDSRLKYLAHQVDFTAGHRFIDASCRLQLHPIIGVRYAKLRHDLSFTIGNVRSNYSGAGPLIGADVLYDFFRNIGLTAHFDSALLLGTVNAHSIINFGGAFKYKSPNTNRLVTSLSGKLGLAYHCRAWKCTRLQFEVGYQANVYIGAFDIITAIVPIPPPTNRIHSLDTTNFAYAGPYLSLAWHM